MRTLSLNNKFMGLACLSFPNPISLSCAGRKKPSTPATGSIQRKSSGSDNGKNRVASVLTGLAGRFFSARNQENARN